MKPIESKKAEVKVSNREENTLKPIPPAEVSTEKTGRELRQERRDQRINEQIKAETGAYGIDLSQMTKAPLTDNAKENITNQVKSIASKELASDIESFSKAYNFPEAETVPTPNEQKFKESYRRERRARWADAMYAFGEGLQGKTANPNVMATTRLKRERDQQYQNYKTSVERNRKFQQIRDNQYMSDLLEFVQDKQKETTLSAAEKEKYRLLEEQIKASNRKTALGESQLAARRDNSYYDTRKRPTAATKQSPIYTQQLDDGSWQLSSGKTPFTDLLYSMTDNSDQLFPDPGNRRYTTAEKEDMAKQLISQGFTIKTDKNGNAVAVPIEGKENYIQKLPAQQKAAQLDQEIKAAENDVNVLQQTYNRSAKDKQEVIKARLINTKKRLSELKQQRDSLQPNSVKKQAGEYDESKSQEYNSFWNSTKKRSTFSDIVQKHQPQSDTIQTNEKLNAFFR